MGCPMTLYFITPYMTIRAHKYSWQAISITPFLLGMNKPAMLHCIQFDLIIKIIFTVIYFVLPKRLLQHLCLIYSIWLIRNNDSKNSMYTLLYLIWGKPHFDNIDDPKINLFNLYKSQKSIYEMYFRLFFFYLQPQ